MKRVGNRTQSGYTLVELMVAVFVLSIIVLSTFTLFTALVKSALLMKRKAVALTLATNQMEYLKSLPYNNLAVAGGSIVASSPLPATTVQTVNGVKYTVKTSINYVDEAYDGCGSYPSTALKQLYCRNYPPPATAPATDTNPADYKSVNVSVTDASGLILSDVDTQIAARVAETASNTGALFVLVIDANGNPLTGANVHVTNTTSTPTVDVNDDTDQNGNTIFYGLPPDSTNYDYNITATLSGYSTLTTIVPSGTLQPNYSNQQILSQQSSFVTLQLKPQGTNSLWVETTNTAGTALGAVKVYLKGGYKRYNLTTNTAYYYDNMTPSDSRLLTDASGNGTLTNLVPGNYYACGDAGATSCTVGATTYYLAAAVPYGGVGAPSTIVIPTFTASSIPSQVFTYNSVDYLQKVRLMLTTSSSFPRITSLTPSEASQSTSTMSAFAFTIKGTNLPCSSSAASCSTTVRLLQGASTFTASCTGAAAGLQLNCTVNISAAAQGMTQLQIVAGGNTLTLPGSPLLGGINVAP
jgi:prepilin-type N-terminal cleavage/methylation domain-containing protein